MYGYGRLRKGQPLPRAGQGDEAANRHEARPHHRATLSQRPRDAGQRDECPREWVGQVVVEGADADDHQEGQPQGEEEVMTPQPGKAQQEGGHQEEHRHRRPEAGTVEHRHDSERCDECPCDVVPVDGKSFFGDSDSRQQCQRDHRCHGQQPRADVPSQQVEWQPARPSPAAEQRQPHPGGQGHHRGKEPDDCAHPQDQRGPSDR